MDKGFNQRIDFLPAHRIQVACHTEVDQADTQIGINKDIARVRISMKQALPQYHIKQHVGDTTGQNMPLFSTQQFDVGIFQQGGSHVLLHQHLPVAVFGIYLGNMHCRMVGIQCGKPLQMTHFSQQIGFPGQAFGKILHHLHRLIAAGFRHFRFGELRQMG